MTITIAGKLGLNPIAVLPTASENLKTGNVSVQAQSSGLPSINSLCKGGTLALLLLSQFKGSEASKMISNSSALASVHQNPDSSTANSLAATPVLPAVPTIVHIPNTTLSAGDLHSLSTFSALPPTTTEVLKLEARNARAISTISRLAGQMEKLTSQLTKTIDKFEDISEDIQNALSSLSEQQLPEELNKLSGEVNHDTLTNIVLNLMNNNEELKKSDLTDADKKEIAEAIAAEIIEFTDPGQTGGAGAHVPNGKLLLTGALLAAGLAI